LKEKKPGKPRNGKLKIELDVEDALRAALETRPPPTVRRKARKKPRPQKHLDSG
jgi:hypothetical protein